MIRNTLSFVKRNPQLAESFLSLSLLNAFNFLLPLVSLPYLVRVVGPENFGIYSFVLVIMQYVILISKYGFTFSGTKFIAENRDNKTIVERNLSAILFIRLSIALSCLIILFGLMLFVPLLNSQKLAYFYALGIVFGDIFIPIWFFQGMEKMRYITIVNLVSRGLFTISIFFVVKEAKDYPLILLLSSISYIIAAIVSVSIIHFQFKIRLVIPNRSDIVFHFKDGWHIFISTISMNLYRNANIFILGLLTNNYIVGIYSSAEKLVKAIQSMVSPISESLFPFLSRKFSQQSKSDNFSALWKISRVYFAGLFIMSLAMLLSSGILIKYVFGEQYVESLSSVRILSFVILFGGMNYLLGIIGLINLGEKKAFTKFVIAAGLTNIVVTLIAVSSLGAIGASLGMLLSEVVLFGLCVNRLVILYRKV